MKTKEAWQENNDLPFNNFMYLATDDDLKKMSVEDIKSGTTVVSTMMLEYDEDGVIVDTSYAGMTIDDALCELSKLGYVRVDRNWDWSNMNPIVNEEHYEKLCEYLPYYATEEAVAKIDKIRKNIFG